MARQYISANSGTPLDEYYSFEFNFQTNSAVDALWYFWGQKHFELTQFTKAIFAFYACSFIASIMVISRVLHGRWSLWPLVAALVVFNRSYFWGFQNYLFTVPFAIFAFALWLSLEKWSAIKRSLVFIPICLALYFMHTLGFAVLLFGAFGREVQRLYNSGKDWKRQFGENLISSVPYLIPLGIILFGLLTGPQNLYGSGTEFGDLESRILGLISAVYGSTSPLLSAQSIFGFLSLIFIIIVVLRMRANKGPVLNIAPKMKGALIVFGLFSLFTPEMVDGVHFVQNRFPFIFLALLIASTKWSGLLPRQAVILTAVFIVLGLGRVVSLDQEAKAYNRDISNLIELFEDLPEGSRLVPTMVKYPRLQPARWHLQAYAIPYAHSFVPTLFQGAHNLTLHEKWLDSAAAQGLTVSFYLIRPFVTGGPEVENYPDFWLANWDAKFTHMLLEGELEDSELDGLPLTKINTIGTFTLFEITPQASG